MSIAPNTPRSLAFTLGDRLRKARESTGHEKREFADMVGIHRESVTRYESGRAAPRRPVLIAWALAAGVDVGWLETGRVPDPDGPAGESHLRDSNSRPIHYKFITPRDRALGHSSLGVSPVPARPVAA